MNKEIINQEISTAYEVLAEVGIAKSGKIDNAFRGQISSFGAAITMGNLKAAIAFFSQTNGASVDRDKIPVAILEVLKRERNAKPSYNTLFQMLNEEGEAVKEDILNAAIALKLAMNLYELVKPKKE